jgi:hypothetical protein
VISVVVRIVCRFQWEDLILHLVLWCPRFFLIGSEVHMFCSLSQSACLLCGSSCQFSSRSCRLLSLSWIYSYQLPSGNLFTLLSAHTPDFRVSRLGFFLLIFLVSFCLCVAGDFHPVPICTPVRRWLQRAALTVFLGQVLSDSSYFSLRGASSPGQDSILRCRLVPFFCASPAASV